MPQDQSVSAVIQGINYQLGSVGLFVVMESCWAPKHVTITTKWTKMDVVLLVKLRIILIVGFFLLQCVD